MALKEEGKKRLSFYPTPSRWKGCKANFRPFLGKGKKKQKISNLPLKGKRGRLLFRAWKRKRIYKRERGKGGWLSDDL